MYKYFNAFTNRSGDVLPGYFAKLFDSNGNHVDIFADANGTPISTVSGVANAALSDENGMFRWYVSNGTYDIRFYDPNDVFISVETGVPMFEASGVYTDLSGAGGAALVGKVGGGTVQVVATIVDNMASFTEFDSTNERVVIGTGTASSDNSAILLARDIVTVTGFDHGARDETNFLSTGDSAYTAFDAAHTYLDNGGLKYNHGYAFQARPLVNAANGMDLFAGVSTQMRVSAGTVDRLFHVHIASLTKTGGTVSSHVGLYISPLTGGAGTNWAIYQESTSNPSYFGSKVRVDNAVATFSATANATLVEFPEGGGTALIGKRGAAELGAIQAFGDSFGTPKSLALQPDGGTLLVGASVPVSGATLEVVGTVTATGTIKAPANRVEGQDVVATGTWTNVVADGVLLAGSRGASFYGAVQAFASGVVNGLSLQPDGGVLLVGASSPTLGGALEVVGQVTASSTLRSGPLTFATLPAAATAGAGARAFITDCNSTTFGAAAAGGGANAVPVYSTGAAWNIG